MTPRDIDWRSVRAKIRRIRELLDQLVALGHVDAARLAAEPVTALALERILTLLVDLAFAGNSHVAVGILGRAPDPDGARQRWLESYLDQLITRDALSVEGGRDPARLRRYFEAYALNSAGLATDRTIWSAAGVDRRTALAYERLLENLLVVDPVPAWTSNRLSRLIRSPKRYLVDAALLAGILRVVMGDDHDLVDDDDAAAGRAWKIVEERPPLREGKVFVDYSERAAIGDGLEAAYVALDEAFRGIWIPKATESGWPREFWDADNIYELESLTLTAATAVDNAWQALCTVTDAHAAQEAAALDDEDDTED